MVMNVNFTLNLRLEKGLDMGTKLWLIVSYMMGLQILSNILVWDYVLRKLLRKWKLPDSNKINFVGFPTADIDRL